MARKGVFKGSIIGASIGALTGGVGLSAPTGAALGGLLGGSLPNKKQKSIEQAANAEGAQLNAQKSDEAAKYQAIVDAKFSNVAKKKSMLTSKGGTNLYSGSGSSGLF